MVNLLDISWGQTFSLLFHDKQWVVTSIIATIALISSFIVLFKTKFKDSVPAASKQVLIFVILLAWGIVTFSRAEDIKWNTTPEQLTRGNNIG